MMFLFISRHMMTRVYAHAYVHVGQMLVRMRDIRVLLAWMKGFDKDIYERHFPQGGAFGMICQNLRIT